jgi:tetratricopeptide (TPR) repeat protein
MKQWIITTFMFVVSSCTPYLFAIECAQTLLKEKSIEKNYYLLIEKPRKCEVKIPDYIAFSKRALVADKYAMSIWGSKKGLESDPDRIEQISLLYILGIAYGEAGRLEEAIISLKQIIFSKDFNADKTVADLSQKAHLALIGIYYKKTNNQNSDVTYLTKLFRSKYPKSEYNSILDSWIKQNI